MKINSVHILVLLFLACCDMNKKSDDINIIETSWIKSSIILNTSLDIHKHGKNTLIHYVTIKNYSSDTLLIPITSNNKTDNFFSLINFNSKAANYNGLYNLNKAVLIKIEPRKTDTLKFATTIYGFEKDTLILKAFNIANEYSMHFESPIGRDGKTKNVLGTQFINKDREFRLEIIMQ